VPSSGADISEIARELSECRQRGLDWLDRSSHNQHAVAAQTLGELAERYTRQTPVHPAGRIARIKTLLRDAIAELQRQGHDSEATLIRDLFFGETYEGPIAPPGVLLHKARYRSDDSETRFRERRQSAFNFLAGFIVQFVDAAGSHEFGTEVPVSASTSYLPNQGRGIPPQPLSAILANRPGRICVLDTSAVLHYTRLDELAWAQRVRDVPLRLIMPVAVVRELDRMNHASRQEFQHRAREILTLLETYVSTTPPDGYTTVRDGVTIEILPDEPGHVRAPSTDLEILDRCAMLCSLTGKPVTIITGDTAMRINALARGIDIIKLPDEDLTS
jgi:PIN domain-containing protein